MTCLTFVITANAAEKALGVFAIKKAYAIDDDPMLANHLIKYNNQSSQHYDLYAVGYSDEFVFDSTAMTGAFKLFVYRVNPDTLRPATKNLIITNFRIVPKEALTYVPTLHAFGNVEKDEISMIKKDDLGEEILYKGSAAQLVGFALTNCTNSTTEYPNK